MPDNINLGNSVAIDTETMGLNPHRDRLCVVQLSDGGGDAHLVQFSAASDYNAPNLKKLLNNDNIIKIFHFARFDLAVLEYYLKVKISNIYCTKIASRLSRTYTDFHGLKELCSELLNISISKAQQSSNWGGDTLSDAQLKYAAQDVLYLHQIKEILDGMLQKEGRSEVATECFNFLSTRIKLDLLGWTNTDIFKH